MLLRNVFPEFSPHKFADISIDILLIPKWFGAKIPNGLLLASHVSAHLVQGCSFGGLHTLPNAYKRAYTGIRDFQFASWYSWILHVSKVPTGF